MNKVIFSSAAVIILIAVGAASYYFGHFLPKIENERISRQAQFNVTARPVLSDYAILADDAVSLAVGTHTLGAREKTFVAMLSKAGTLKETIQALEPPNDEMVKFVEYLSGLTDALSDYARAELRLIRWDLENRALKDAIGQFRNQSEAFASGDLEDAARYQELSERANRTQNIYQKKQDKINSLANSEIPEKVRSLYRDSQGFLNAYRGMLGNSAGSLWSKVAAFQNQGSA